MGNRKKRATGPQHHAEGQHGEKTHRRFIEQLHEGTPESKEVNERSASGRSRLHADRQQHDEAEKNSENERAMKELDRAG